MGPESTRSEPPNESGRDELSPPVTSITTTTTTTAAAKTPTSIGHRFFGGGAGGGIVGPVDDHEGRSDHVSVPPDEGALGTGGSGVPVGALAPGCAPDGLGVSDGWS
jgi:hypothetical protein